MGKIFNIIGCSLALAGTFAANPVAHDYMRKLLPMLMRAVRMAPRPVRIANLRPYQGKCYIVDLDEWMPDDRVASSTVILFEDGNSIKRAPYEDVGEFAEKGGAGVLHVKDKLIFATHDGSSPLTNGRKYFAMQSLTRDAGVFARLVEWRKQSASQGARRLFEMLPILCPRHFTYGGLRITGEAVEMTDVSLALDHRAELRMKARSIAVGPRAEGSLMWQMSIRDIAPESDPEQRWNVELIANMHEAPSTLLPYVEVRGPGGLQLSYRVGQPGHMEISAGRLRALRDMMQPWFTDTTGVSAWLGELIDLLRIPLDVGGLGLDLDAPGEAALRNMLSDETVDATRGWTISARKMRLGADAA